MADQTILATSNVAIDSGPNNDGNLVVNVFTTGGSESNGLFRFDVTSLSGKMWDSAQLRLSSNQAHGAAAFTDFYISRCLQAVVYNQCTSVIFATASNWNATFGESSVDNDHTSRVDQSSILNEVAWADNQTIPFLDISDIVKPGVLQDAGTLDILMYGTGDGTTRWHSLESGESTDRLPNLFLRNVQDMEATSTSGEGTATNVAVPSASSLSKSGRPPIAGADRQYSATILHDGVEPMNILSITLKGTFGADN